MIKFEHTLFALPFAFLGAVLAAEGVPTAWQAIWITVAMVGARSAAMSFNRIADREIDARNPRTETRELPTGKLSFRFAWGFMIASSAVFFAAAAMLNRLTLYLSPLALVSILGYSYSKRFTYFSHLMLGWALAISPTGAWIAVRGAIDSIIPLWLSLFVLLWTSGFDILYACQDYEFDKRSGLRSIPARFGIAGALVISRGFHLAAVLVLIVFYLSSGLNWIAAAGVVGTASLMFYQHTLVSPTDLSRMNAAFFTANAFVSVVLFVTFGAAVLFSG